jgi:putative ABC transport system permease protein
MTRQKIHVPPRPAAWMIRRLTVYEKHFSLEGDLLEAFRETVSEQGVVRARRWYWHQTSRALAAYIRYIFRGGLSMIENYLKSSFRHIKKDKGYVLLNVFGIAVGLACTLLILLYVQDELSYDRYHKNAGRIFRIASNITMGGREGRLATQCAPMGRTLVEDFPEVENACRFREVGSFIFQYGDVGIKENRVVFADSTFFQIFSVSLILGDPRTALSEPNTLVLSRSTARRYFGHEDPMGKILRIDNSRDMMVAGVFSDIPANSHFHFDAMISMASREESRETTWLKNNFNTYILLQPDASAEELESKLPILLERYMAPEVQAVFGKDLDEMMSSMGVSVRYFIQPMTDIHLRSDLEAELEPNSDIQYVTVFSLIALFILVIASINFINLSTARSAGRAREIGIRKVVGSTRGQLLRQFLIESVLLSFAALFLAMLMAYVALPLFNQLAGKEMRIEHFLSARMVLSTFGLTFLIGFLSGLYPAVFLSGFNPLKVLKGGHGSSPASSTGERLRAPLVVIQFTASIILLIGTVTIYKQLRHIQQAKIGYDKERVVVVEDAYLLGGQAETFKKEMVNHPEVISGSLSGYLPIPSDRANMSVFPEGRLDHSNATSLECWEVDTDYIKTLRMRIIMGRDFSPELATDSTVVILNQAASSQFGWDDPLGKRVSRVSPDVGGDFSHFTVIGVVEDFHFESLRSRIGPLMMYLGRDLGRATFRVRTGDLSGFVGTLRDTWRRFGPGQPFNYAFMDDRFDAIYRSEQRLGRIMAAFSSLAVLVGCLGLFGLASYVAEQKTKEIGIRKVLGATSRGVIFMLSRQFLKWVLVANAVAWPLAYWMMTRWLNGFAYRTGLGPELFLLAAVAAIAVAFITVSVRAVKAAWANPVDTLRYE